MVGMLFNGTVGIAVSDLTQTQARQSVISFSYPVFYEPEALFLSCVPARSLESKFSIANIFDLGIWLALVVSTLLCFAQLMFVIKILADRSIGSSASGAFWQILETLCYLRSGTMRGQKPTATRIVQTCFALLILVLLRGLLSSDLYASFRETPEGPVDDWETFAHSCRAGKRTLVVLQGEAQTAFLAGKIDFRDFSVKEIEQIDTSFCSLMTVTSYGRPILASCGWR